MNIDCVFNTLYYCKLKTRITCLLTCKTIKLLNNEYLWKLCFKKEFTEIPLDMIDGNTYYYKYKIMTNLNKFAIKYNCYLSIWEICQHKSFYFHSSTYLKFIPKEIGALQNLLRLRLNDNNLVSIPTELCNLTKLITLDLSWNKLTIIPTEIGNLINLEHLHLFCNHLTFIPTEIGNLFNLHTLNFRHNKIKFIPTEINNLRKTIVEY